MKVASAFEGLNVLTLSVSQLPCAYLHLPLHASIQSVVQSSNQRLCSSLPGEDGTHGSEINQAQFYSTSTEKATLKT